MRLLITLWAALAVALPVGAAAQEVDPAADPVDLSLYEASPAGDIEAVQRLLQAVVPASPFAKTGECPDRIVYGDPAHPNKFTFLSDGKERVLHFERVAVSIDPEGLHTFYIPLFGQSGGWPTRLSITVSTDTEQGPVARIGVLGGAPADCIRIVPDLRWHWLQTAVEVLSYEPPGAGSGRLTAELRFVTGDESPSGLVARIDTEHVTLLSASAGDARGTQLRTSDDGVRDTVAVGVAATALFREATGVLEIGIIAEQGQLHETALDGVSGGPQLVTVHAGSRVMMYDILEFSPAGLTYDEYFHTVEVSEPASEPILERIRAAPTVDLEDAEWLRRMEIPVVVTLPDLPFLEVGAPGRQQAMPDDPRGPALGIDDLPPPAPRDMAPPTESQAFFNYYPAHDLFRPEYTETVSRGADSAFVLRIQDGIRRPAGEPGGPEAEPAPAPEPEAVEEVLGILYEIVEAMEPFEEPDDEAAHERWAAEQVTAVLERRGIALQRAATGDDLNAFFEGGEIPFFLESYAPEAVLEARLYLAAGMQADRRLRPNAAVTEVRDILTEIWAGTKLLAGAPDEAAAGLLFAEHLAGVLERRGIVLEGSPEGFDVGFMYGDGPVPSFLEAYGQEVVQDAAALFTAVEFGSISAIYDSFLDEARAYDVELHLDQTGAPLRREFTERNTAFRIEYRSGHVFITAENAGQGADTVTVRVPPGTLDLLQWNDVLSRLPLAVGFQRTLTFFDLDVHSIESMGIGVDGQGYSRRYTRATPVYVAATVRVTGRETFELGGERVAAYRAEVFFGGRPAHPVMSLLGADLNVRGREGEPFVYLLRASAPHRVLKVDWRETVVQTAVQ
jgi:hypothetical protein